MGKRMVLSVEPSEHQLLHAVFGLCRQPGPQYVRWSWNWYRRYVASKIFKFTERVNMKFDANGFNMFNHTNFLLAHAGGYAHNKYYQGNFGQADATSNPRQLQFGLKLSF